MDASSTYTSNSNFIDPSFVSSVCPVQGMRLIQEQKGSGCFQANRADCSFGCMPFFDANSCLAQASLPPSSVPSTMTKTTKTPSLSPAMPSGVPSTSPSQKPVSQKPVSQKPVVSQRPVSQKPVSQKPVSLTGVPSLPPNTTMPTYQPQTTAPSPGSVTLPPINTAPPAEHVPSTAPTDALYGWLRKPSSYPANKQTLRPAGTPSPTIAPSSKPLCNCSKGSKGGKSKNKKKKGKRRTLQGYVYNFNAADNDYNGDDNYVRNDNYYCRCPSSQGKKGSKGTKGSKGKKGRKASSSKNSHNNAHDSWVTNALYFWTGE